METVRLRVSGIDFDSAHMLPSHPKCSRLHGHSYQVEVTVDGSIDPHTQMVLDFGVLKALAREVAEKFDHKFIADQKDAFLTKDGKFGVHVGYRVLYIPDTDVVQVFGEATVEIIAATFLKDIVGGLTEYPNIKKIGVRISEGNAKSAEVWYDRY